MCGFLVYEKTGNNSFIQKRGQDATTIIKRDGYTFVHNLLSITGDFSPQPFIDGNIVCLYNGEIYNHPFTKSDGENLIPLYKQYGVEFPKYLDGEWAIALYDFDKHIAFFATDLFATKPLWRNGLACGSYHSGVGGHKIPANTIEIVNFKGKEESINFHQWDLEQYKTSYDDWILALERAIQKRATPTCFVGLSSGYDSGAIVCSLLKHHLPFKSYVIEAKEDISVLHERIALLKDYEYITTTENFSDEKTWVETSVEPFAYIGGEGSIQKDSASYALSKICRLAHDEGRKVYLSGQGADEILSDYSLYPKQSTFKGTFPKSLYLWENFYSGCQYNYLAKEEYVAGSHSIETRYPFLDCDVVQEFLWLAPELKNKHYKAPLYEYLKRNNFPFKEGVKIGLRV